jgi:ribosomal protein L44E
LDFLLKHKINGDTDKKKQKKIFEDIQKGDLDKVKEKTTKTFDFNYQCDQGMSQLTRHTCFRCGIQ